MAVKMREHQPDDSGMWVGGTGVRRIVGCSLFFFFQAEDGIRDYKVTGVQTCALPISPRTASRRTALVCHPRSLKRGGSALACSTNIWSRNGTRLSMEAAMLIWSCFIKIGRASCRERV